MGHGEGQTHVGHIGIHGGLSGHAEGHPGDAHGGVQIRPAQLLHRHHRAGENGVVIGIGQGVEAIPCLLRQLGKISKVRITGGVPGNLGRQIVGLVPVIQGGLGKLLQIVAGHFQTHILRQGSGVVVQAPHHGVEHIKSGEYRQHPAGPLNGVPFENQHQHQAGQNQHPQGHRQHLPHGKVHTGRPLRQHPLEGADDVGVDHVHQGGESLAELHQHPGDGGENAGCQIAEPISQRKRLL